MSTVSGYYEINDSGKSDMKQNKAGLAQTLPKNWPLAALGLFLLITSVYCAWNFQLKFATWYDDNFVYYAERAFEKVKYTSDIWHNSFQQDYVWLTIFFWAPFLSLKYFGISPIVFALPLSLAKI